MRTSTAGVTTNLAKPVQMKVLVYASHTNAFLSTSAMWLTAHVETQQQILFANRKVVPDLARCKLRHSLTAQLVILDLESRCQHRTPLVLDSSSFHCGECATLLGHCAVSYPGKRELLAMIDRSIGAEQSGEARG
ncbi:hypothetical protein E2P81_ATG08220 [Venturia nashicola]|uniref:Uncharacterized protein n=1 Tax=Venturia nashicola TaxID=86259 RepID=A0A4Z1NHG9_9PEZI|nr:hypothetical protein E6O75_ATG08402 [Venturia nashicola]TLD21632.1 hypothetical protein E2P81_ATG08220 [Venturia nashicola]